RSGVLVYKKDPFALATLAFGYGLSVTPIQLAQAYAILANGGVKIPLTLLRLNKLPVGKRVMDEKVAKEMLSLLETVVLAKEGTGRPARVPGYHVAGKTGTAKMVKDGVYEKHRYVASFVGIAPLNNPRLVVAVIIRDPRGKEYYGGLVSGPVFEKIMEGSLRTLNIPPDDLHSLNETSG
ncbi:MAG TPA: penicillin-binding transpeptidase domain-containing protein, partial [Gammaproteobacteria bacterium]|nr:penicillin-binding transpeptidase domain-containing protein [Gammaproteobacteria bacterium]